MLPGDHGIEFQIVFKLSVGLLHHSIIASFLAAKVAKTTKEGSKAIGH